MAQHDHQRRSEAFDREFDAADLRRRNDVAGNPDHEQVAETLVENNFSRHPRIGATDNNGKGFLTRHQPVAPTGFRLQRMVLNLGHEPPVTLEQGLQRLLGSPHNFSLQYCSVSRIGLLRLIRPHGELVAAGLAKMEPAPTRKRKNRLLDAPPGAFDFYQRGFQVGSRELDVVQFFMIAHVAAPASGLIQTAVS
jgi:hypothetical protein